MPPLNTLCSTGNPHPRPGDAPKEHAVPRAVLVLSSAVGAHTDHRVQLLCPPEAREHMDSVPSSPLVTGGSTFLFGMWENKPSVDNFPQRDPLFHFFSFIPWGGCCANVSRAAGVTSFKVLYRWAKPITLKCKGSWHTFFSDFGPPLTFLLISLLLFSIANPLPC